MKRLKMLFLTKTVQNDLIEIKLVKHYYFMNDMTSHVIYN